MKKIIFLIAISLFVLMHTACIDREIIESKGNVALPAVADLSYTMSGNIATLKWSVPDNIPQEMERPLEVYVQVLRYQPGILNPVRVHNETLPDEATSATYTVPENTDTDYEYHAVVKLTGSVKKPEYGKTDRIYSLGQTVVLSR
jgi:hypothetical protein